MVSTVPARRLQKEWKNLIQVGNTERERNGAKDRGRVNKMHKQTL